MRPIPRPGRGSCWRATTRPQHTPDGGQAGAVAAELVVATPLLLVLVLLVVQFALWQHGVHVATAAAEEGERSEEHTSELQSR